MHSTIKILILYSELADYTVACLRELVALNANVTLIHWPINPEAPFQFDLSFCEHHDRSEFSDKELDELLNKTKPDLILCSGWMDKGYLKACRAAPNSTIRVLSLDNHWIGSWKQRIAQLVAPFTIRQSFDRAFVPGQPQLTYALKLGFSKSEIQTGFYSADATRFDGFFHQMDKKVIPKRFLFLGRYVKHKGIFDLWDAFKRFRSAHPKWELWCVGTGDQFENRPEAEGMRHFGFIQPEQMLPILMETGVYILPSHFEPWGVSVHEMAVAGFPMLLSDQIGAREAYLNEEVNGAVFQSGSVDSLLSKMNWIASMSNAELLSMSAASHRLGMTNSPEIWAHKLLSFVS